MKKNSILILKFISGLTLLACVSQVKAITPEEIYQQNAEAEQACEASKNFGSVSGNEMLNHVSNNNYRFFWSLLKDDAKYRTCKLLTPKKLAQLMVSATPGLAEKINAVINGGKTDTQKGKDLEILIEEQMSPQYGYANNNKAHIRMAPGLGLVRLGWEDDVQSQNCPTWKVNYICPNGLSDGGCYYEYYHSTQYDSIYPDYDIYRVVNGVEKYLGTIEGTVVSKVDENINISFTSANTLLSSIGKDLVKSHISKLKKKDPTIPSAVNVFYDPYADIYKNSVVRYKLEGKDPGNSRFCGGKIGSFSYYVNYDMNADGVPDFVDEQWYSAQIDKANTYATVSILIPIISSLLLN